MQRVHLYIRAVAGDKLGTLSMQAQNFNSWLISQFCYNIFSWMIKQVHNSLSIMTVHEIWNLIIFLDLKTSLGIAHYDSSWDLKFDNFSGFENVIRYSSPLPPSVIMTHCVRKSIRDSPLMLRNIAFWSYVYILFLFWPYLLNAQEFTIVLLSFSVLPCTYSVIYSEKYDLYLGKF